jgi:hypothetical protein
MPVPGIPAAAVHSHDQAPAKRTMVVLEPKPYSAFDASGEQVLYRHHLPSANIYWQQICFPLAGAA